MNNIEKELNKESEKYEIINNIKIIDDDIIFNYNSKKYKLEFYELVNYLYDYYTYDDYIFNFDDLMYYIEELARNLDINDLLNLFENLKYSNIESEYFIIDSVYKNVDTFENLEELKNIYNIVDIVEEICENDKINDYCVELND